MYRRGPACEFWHVHAFRLGPYRFHLCWRPSCRAKGHPGDSVPAAACCRCERVGVREHHPQQPRQVGSRRLSFSFDNSPCRGVGKIANPPRNPRPLRPKRTEGNSCTPPGARAIHRPQGCRTATDLRHFPHTARTARAERCNGNQNARNPTSLWMRARRFASHPVVLRYSFSECRAHLVRDHHAKFTACVEKSPPGRRIPER